MAGSGAYDEPRRTQKDLVMSGSDSAEGDVLLTERAKLWHPGWKWRVAFVLCVALAILCAVLTLSLPRSWHRSGWSALQGSPDAEEVVTLQAVNITRPIGRFCGIAVPTEKGNSDADLKAVAESVSAGKLWHYNWKTKTTLNVPGVEFVPMVNPGKAKDLPPARTNGAGPRVLSWNEPDNINEAGSDGLIYNNPEQAAVNWTSDMQIAKQLGYWEFVTPAVRADPCWLDHFLKGCSLVPGCKDLVTHLAFHRFRQDCATYEASIDNEGWRDDLGYILSFNRIREKYNLLGFHIQGILLTEFGCLNELGECCVPENESAQYMDALFVDTVAKVMSNDRDVVSNITDSDQSRWIGPQGPDAADTDYVPGTCEWTDAGENGHTGEAAVRAIRALQTMAWRSSLQNHSYLFSDDPDSIGKHFSDACKAVQDPPAEGWEFPLNGAHG